MWCCTSSTPAAPQDVVEADGKLTYMGWRETAAILERPRPHEDIAESMSKMVMKNLGAVVEAYLSMDDTPHQRTEFLTWDVPAMMPADSKGFAPVAHMLLSKVRAINALGGPRMNLVWWGTLCHLGRIPKYPDDHLHILDAEKLLEEWVKKMDEYGKVQCPSAEGGTERRIVCMSMFSHRWARPSMDPAQAFPDTVDNKKCKALGYYGYSGLCPVFSEHQFDYYYWIDYAGVNQSDYLDKLLGIAKLPLYISCCIEMIFYNSEEYERRAWTRLERILGFHFVWAPLFPYMDDNYPEQPANLKELATTSPHVFRHDEESDTLHMHILDPCGDDCSITDPRDREYIINILNILSRTKPVNPQFKAGGEFLFGESAFVVDTMHGKFDAEKKAQRDQRVATIIEDITAKHESNDTGKVKSLHSLTLS
mmetsp:Transcript_44812/g.130517  ORF Transcript_44812/g.130517 Transcript_44812/m.130517 type:complete len:423 (-) Transcript_44812:199-1467(-)